MAEREGNHSLVILATASSGIAQVEHGNVVEGTTELERAVADLRKIESSLDLARVQFWLARAYFESGQTALAKENLARVLKLGDRFGCRPFSLAEGRRAAAFLAWGADESDPVNRLRAWLDELRVEVTPALVEARLKPVAPPRIEVRAFGSGSVYRDGRQITLQEWGGSATARELLFYLLDQSPQRKELIGHAFWPEHSPAKMTTVFHAVKYKVRRALGVEFVVFRDDRYEIDPAAGIWYDVAEFDRLLDSAQRRAGDDPERLAELQQAATLYRGDFLTGVYSNWATERRHALHARYFEAVQQLLDILLRRQQFEQALELCQRGIEFDYYREDLHRAIMSSLAETGRRAEALLHYRALARRFRKELRASPAQETRDLVVRIRSPR
jgi:DNA-binding SARP family transcriptional activator